MDDGLKWTEDDTKYVVLRIPNLQTLLENIDSTRKHDIKYFLLTT